LTEEKQGAERQAMARADARDIERESDYRLDADEVSAQVGQKPQGGRPEGGINAASKELGVERTQAQRAVKIASITPEAKKAAKD